MERSLKTYWSNKSVLITGASSGLGWALTHALAPYEIHFCLLSRREKELQTLAGQLRTSGSSFWIRACDVRNRNEVEGAVQDFLKETPRLDVAWVNSGVGGETSRKKWDWEFVETMIDTNLKGALYTSQACLKVMAKQKRGALVGIGSVISMRGLPTRSIYSAGKIAFSYYLEAMATEYPELQITTIHPGFVDTAMNRDNPNRIFLQTPERAAQLMIKAVAKKKRVFIYPWQMQIIYYSLKALPYGIYKHIARQMIRQYSS